MRPRFLLFALLLLCASCGSDASGPIISDARIGLPTGPNAALYFTAAGGGEADSLVSAATDVASTVEIHGTTTNADGTMSMESLPALELPSNGELVLEPGSFHLMLVDVDRLEIDSAVEIVLTWRVAGEQTVLAQVVGPGETMGHGMPEPEASG